MRFYIKMPADSDEDAVPVGDLEFSTFWRDTGFFVIEDKISTAKDKYFAENAIIIDDKAKKYTVNEFLDLLQEKKVKLR